MAGQIGHMFIGPAGRVARDVTTQNSEVLEAAGRGEPQARGDLLETARFISVAAANLTALINPSLIVLGGALFADAPTLVPAVSAAVQSIACAPVAVVPSALGRDASLWGGLIVALNGARERVRRELREHSRASA
jgi:predicted NBD/HSP70 family sugar kinase